jgi:hypothetical protein
MASSGKKKTTMAKLTRESRLRERRMEKQARKLARKEAAAHPPDPFDEGQPEDGMDVSPGETGEENLSPVTPEADQSV